MIVFIDKIIKNKEISVKELTKSKKKAHENKALEKRDKKTGIKVLIFPEI